LVTNFKRYTISTTKS